MMLRLHQLEPREAPAAYTVAVTGSDAADGVVTPWRTLQKAADSVAPGDTVSVQPGTYAGMNLTRSGTTAARITFAAQPGVTVTSPNPWNHLDGINLEGASHVTVRGFTVNNMPRTGLRAVLAAGVEFRNNTADSNGTWGILTGFCDDLLVEGNVTSRSKQQHGIYVGNSGDRPVIRGNVSWGNDDCGIHLNGDLSLGGDGIISGALIENNVLYGNGSGGGSSLNMDGVQFSTVRNNLIYDAKAGGIAIFRIDGGGPSAGNQITDNTVLVGSVGRWAVALSGGATGNTLKNNVIYSSHSFRGAVSITPDSLPGLVSDFNAVEDRFSTDDGDSAVSLAGWRAATGQDLHSFAVASPTGLFTADWHLPAGSPLVDAGTPTSVGPAYDWEADVRPQGGGWDIGHDEFPVPLSLVGSKPRPAKVFAAPLPPARVSDPFPGWAGGVWVG